MPEKRVVITGMGAVTPLANSVADTWKGLVQGRSGIGPITIFDASTFPTNIAGEIKNLDMAVWNSRVESPYLGRNSFFALEAAQQAVADARIDTQVVDPVRYGIYFAAGDGGFNFEQYAAILGASRNPEDSSVNVKRYWDQNTSRSDAKRILEQEPAQVIHHLAKYFRTQGPVINCLTACAASSQAIGEAAEIIRRGDADLMISGGTHSMIHPLGVAGFNLLTALSTRNDQPQKASRPFDKDRDGFVLSEGAAVLILEELEHAKRRGANIYAEFAGYGGTADAFRMTDPQPDGRGGIRAMQLALLDANMTPQDIQYINAHGTSTQLNDQIETLAVKKVFGEHSKNVPMSSIKSMLGHMIAAAGAMELIACILAMRDGIIPPTINYETPDETCDLDYVPNEARKADLKAVLSNSFGFGGQNIALIVKKY
jgi:3-oxoacyl-[acyl-carrier-protein] synthase II